MQKVKIIFKSKGTNIQERIRKIFGKYVSVSILIQDKLYTIKPGSKIIVESYSPDINDISYDIIIPNTFVYSKAERFLRRQEGKRFDLFGATLGQSIGLGFQDENKWFDSELITKYLQYCLFDEVMEYNASKISINTLEKIVKEIVDAQKEQKDAAVTRTGISKRIQDFKSKIN